MNPLTCHRFQSSAYRSNQWRYRGRCDSIQFCVDRRIFICGFGMYGSSNGSADYTVRIQLKHNGKLMADNTASFQSDGSSNTYVTIDQSEAFLITIDQSEAFIITIDQSEASIITIDQSGSTCSLTTRCRLRRTSPTQPQPSWMEQSSLTLDRYSHISFHDKYNPMRRLHYCRRV